MKKHIHFLLLGLGTVVFLMMMRMYTAPLTQDHDYPIKDPQWVINYTILDMNMNELHTTYIVKASLKTFAGYLAFVVIVFGHRLFYGSSRSSTKEVASS